MRRQSSKSNFSAKQPVGRHTMTPAVLAIGTLVAMRCLGGWFIDGEAWAQSEAAEDTDAEDGAETGKVVPDPFVIPTPEGTPMEVRMPSEDYYPCTDCHEGRDINLEPRKLEEEHESIELKHAENRRWCLDCHSPEQRNKLRLASGVLIGFEDSYRLCGQCHGSILSDWQAGLHGKRVGNWNGDKQFYLCSSCHSAHAPAFKPLKPEPAPMRAEDIQ